MVMINGFMERNRIFYGWVIVFCSVILLALALGMFSSTNSLFVIPICDSLGFSRGQFTLYRTVVTLVSAFLMPFYGRVIQKIGVKKVLFTGSLMLGIVTIGYSFAANLWHFYVLAFINGLFASSISFMSIGVLVNAWFDGKKGLATGLAYAGSGLGGAIMIPVVSNIIEVSGWQWAYRFMGLLGIAIMMPVIALFVKNSPEIMGLKPLAPNNSEREKIPAVIDQFSFREALHTPKFWMLATAFFLINFFASATNTHSAPYLSDLGYTTVFVSYVIALFMIFLTVGKIILGFVYDHFGAMAGNIIVCIFCLGFPILALLSHIPAIPWFYAVFIGMASCGVSIPIPVLIVRHFGNKDFPTIFSFCVMISTLAQSVSVPAMGTVHDLTGSYGPAWIILLFTSVIITVCLIGVEIINRNVKKINLKA